MSVIGSAARCERLRYCRTYQLGLLLLRNSTVVRRSLILHLLLLFTSPAIGDQRSAPEPALTYRVVNVAPDDVLRVRSQPDASAPVIDNLPANATGIILTGVRRNVGQATWWQIVVKSAMGTQAGSTLDS